MTVFHKWRPIEDLPEDWQSLTDGELDSLLLVWQDQKASLEEAGLLKDAVERVNREWAIETGIIEDAYTLDRGVTETLVLQGISADRITRESTNLPPERLAEILHDHLDTLEGIFAFVKGERPISTSYVKELHASLLRNVDTFFGYDSQEQLVERPLQKGAYKLKSNSVRREDGLRHEYAPPEHVASEMDRLLAIAQCQIDRNVAVEVRSAWLHHRFTQIHPFEDGNGRVARALASAVFVKAGWYPLSVHRDQRSRYIDALEVADHGDLRGLVGFFVSIQRRTMFQVLDSALAKYSPSDLDDALRIVKAKHRASEVFVKDKHQRVNLLQRDLFGVATNALHEAAAKVNNSLGLATDGASVESDSRSSELSTALASTFALDLGLRPIRLRFGTTHSLWLAFGTPKPGFIGVIDVWALWTSPPVKFEPLSAEPFSFNYRDEVPAAQSRLLKWLAPIIAQAVVRWGGPNASS